MHLQKTLFPSPKIADIPTWPIRFLQVENSDICCRLCSLWTQGTFNHGYRECITTVQARPGFKTCIPNFHPFLLQGLPGWLDPRFAVIIDIIKIDYILKKGARTYRSTQSKTERNYCFLCSVTHGGYIQAQHILSRYWSKSKGMQGI